MTLAGFCCAFPAKFQGGDGRWFCGRHVSSNGNPRARRAERRRQQRVSALALTGCTGVTKKNARCRNWGKHVHDGRTFCKKHLPSSYKTPYEDLAARPIVQYGDIGVNVDDDCPICYNPLKLHTIVKTNCGHAFHKECIDRWLERVEQCPLCRTVTHIRCGPCPVRRIEIVDYL